MADYSDRYTEEKLTALEGRLQKLYRDTGRELGKIATDYFDAFKVRDLRMKERCSDPEAFEKMVKGTASEGMKPDEYYKQWRLAQIGRGERFEKMRDLMADRATRANETAASYINDTTPGVYTLNRNYSAYLISGAADVSFTAYDESTVRRLAVEEPETMPYYPEQRAIDRGIDLAYGKKQITANVTSGILQGKSIGKMADDLQARITDMNRKSAVRAARTAVTSAQNGGRQATYEAAESMGIRMEKEWLATSDDRTRASHVDLNGERVPVDKPFSNGLMFPGDPSGPAAEVYNCRCTMVAVLIEGGASSAVSINTKISSDRETVLNPMDQSTYLDFVDNLSKEGVRVVASTEGDDLRYLQYFGAEAMAQGDDQIMHIGSIPSASAMLEEMIHITQAREYGIAESTDMLERTVREIDANRLLLANADFLGLDSMDKEDIERNLKIWENDYKERTGNDYDKDKSDRSVSYILGTRYRF